MQSITRFQTMKAAQQKISMVTCYDFWSAQLVAESAVDSILVGDSLAVVMHGFPSTVHATLDLMLPHVAAVARGAGDKIIIADMPFMTASSDVSSGVAAATALIQAGAHAVKIEGAKHQRTLIAHLVEAGLPVVGHLGLTPQAVLQLGGHRVQAKTEATAKVLCQEAEQLERVGIAALVLECVPAKVASLIAQSLDCPVIGIGAGPGCDGQILVSHDMLGLYTKFHPRFVRRYAELGESMREAFGEYIKDVQSGSFPNQDESY